MLLLGSKYVPVKYYGGDLMEKKYRPGGFTVWSFRTGIQAL